MRWRSPVATSSPTLFGVEAPAPDAMLGSMAALPVPGVSADTADALHDVLETEDRIQVPVGAWPVPAARDGDREPMVLVRISAQRYNELADYEWLAAALRRRTQAAIR